MSGKVDVTDQELDPILTQQWDGGVRSRHRFARRELTIVIFLHPT
jgi:hypothetical protein